jgi:hypothetical protein
VARAAGARDGESNASILIHFTNNAQHNVQALGGLAAVRQRCIAGHASKCVRETPGLVACWTTVQTNSSVPSSKLHQCPASLDLRFRAAQHDRALIHVNMGIAWNTSVVENRADDYEQALVRQTDDVPILDDLRL